MTISFNIRLTIAIILILIGCTQQDSSFTSKPLKSEELSAIIQHAAEVYELPSIGVAVVSGNETLSKVFSRDENHQYKEQDSSIFFMGSISEVMVTTAIAKLVSDGKLNLDDAVVKHLPYFKLENKTNNGITIRHLLTQTSGIPKHNAVWDLPYDGPDALPRTTQSIAEQQAEFLPGTKVMRSQYNFDILADLIRQVSGTSFESFTKKNIFDSLDMRCSSFDVKVFPESRINQPFIIRDWLAFEREPMSTYPYNPEHAGSIGYHASMEDMCIWMSTLLLENTFLKKEVREELLRDQYKTGNNIFVGLGWEGFNSNKVILTKNHTIGGFSGNITLIPEDQIGVVVVSNTGDHFDAAFISRQIISWLQHKNVKAPQKSVHLAMARKLKATNNIDSAFALYTNLKKQEVNTYDLSENALTEFGVLLLHRVNDKQNAVKAFTFVQEQFPNSKKNHVNLAEAYLLQDSIEKAEEELSKAKGLVGTDPALTAHLIYLTDLIKSKKEQRDYEHATVMAMPE